jgi:prepilin-type processing-associated H-X9-DG protein
MDENLIGYLLDALDSDTRLETEKHLLKDPDARERLASLRQALEPLEADREADYPPPELWVRTLARVAEYRCRHLPAAPKPGAYASGSDGPVHRSWWRRADVLVAASVLFCVSLIIPSVLAKIRFQRDLVACQNNLHNFYIGLQDFSDRHHGNFPDVATAVPAPWNVAGNFVPILMDEGLIGDNVSVQCPAYGRLTPPQYTLHELRNMDPEQLESRAWNLGGSYAYNLGYRDSTGDHGPRLDPKFASSMRPLVADRPPRDIMLGATANSPNHGGGGQNVLFMDGHCVYCTQRVLPCSAGGFDDIYLNQDNQVHAGRTPWDTVLGDSQAHP